VEHARQVNTAFRKRWPWVQCGREHPRQHDPDNSHDTAKPSPKTAECHRQRRPWCRTGDGARRRRSYNAGRSAVTPLGNVVDDDDDAARLLGGTRLELRGSRRRAIWTMGCNFTSRRCRATLTFPGRVSLTKRRNRTHEGRIGIARSPSIAQRPSAKTTDQRQSKQNLYIGVGALPRAAKLTVTKAV